MRFFARALRQRADRAAVASLFADPSKIIDIDEAIELLTATVPDLVAVERSGAYRGQYHVLHGKLSPIHGVGPEDLNLASLVARLKSGGVEELILALSNDVEGEATCHYLTEQAVGVKLRITRIGFGLPSGAGVVYADAVTLKSAMEGRREYS